MSFPMKHGNVLVSKLPSKDQTASSQQPSVVGTSATVDLCRLKEKVDPAVDMMQIKDTVEQLCEQDPSASCRDHIRVGH